jgi:hypothetical protein
MSRKKKTSDFSQYLEHKEFTEAGHIKERYPQVAGFALELAYVDPDGWSPTRVVPIVRKPQDKAYFKFTCPQRECVRGGHDLTTVIKTLIHDGEHEASGEMVCMGWQDQERVNHFRCLWMLQYKVTVTYHDQFEDAEKLS